MRVPPSGDVGAQPGEDDPQRRPEWAGTDTHLIAVAEDLVSGSSYRAWRRPSTPHTGRFRSRNRPYSFVVERASTGEMIAVFDTWPNVVAWHDRTLISAGWRVLMPPDAEQPSPAGSDAPAHGEVVPE